jgi:large subunit ribosomal protein L20
MPRVKKGAARRRAKKRIFKAVKGRYGEPGHLIRQAKETAIRAGRYARADRRAKKGDFRGLWITRLSAACRTRGMMYSRFIDGCKKAKIALNRKMLSDMAISDPQAFDAIFGVVKAALPK